MAIQNPAIIIWKDVKYNNGGHYSPVTGAYTTPLSGYYQFTVSKTTGVQWAYFYLVIDGEDFCFQGTFDSGGWQQKSSTMTVKLNAGSKVQIKNHYATEIYGFGVFSSHPGIYSWFSGHLLFPA